MEEKPRIVVLNELENDLKATNKGLTSVVLGILSILTIAIISDSEGVRSTAIISIAGIGGVGGGIVAHSNKIRGN